MTSFYWIFKDQIEHLTCTTSSWIGPFSTLATGVPYRARITKHSFDDSFISNMPALEKLPWHMAGEVIHDSSQLLEEILFLSTHPHQSHQNHEKRDAVQHLIILWESLIKRFPILPWPKVTIARGSWSWPKAISVPGMILVNRTFELDLPSVYLYLVHELIHQWIGCLTIINDCPAHHDSNEAFVDALAWHICSSANPRVDQVFQRLYARYSSSRRFQKRAELVTKAIYLLRLHGCESLVNDLETSRSFLLSGDRKIFSPWIK